MRAYSIIEIHREKRTIEVPEYEGDKPIDTTVVDMTYAEYTTENIKRKIFKFKTSSWEFDKKHNIFLG